MATERPRHCAAQAKDIVSITNALDKLRIVVEEQVINIVSAILDVANNTAATIQHRFGENVARGVVVEQDSIADRIPKPRGTITNHHV